MGLDDIINVGKRLGQAVIVAGALTSPCGISQVRADPNNNTEAEIKVNEEYNTLMEQGQRFTTQKNYAQAIQSFEKAIQVKPNDLEAHLALGLSQTKNDNYSAARQTFDRAIEIDGNSKTALVRRGLVEMQAGQFHESIQYFNQALELDQFHATALSNKAHATYEIAKQAYAQDNQNQRKIAIAAAQDSLHQLYLARVIAKAFNHPEEEQRISANITTLCSESIFDGLETSEEHRGITQQEAYNFGKLTTRAKAYEAALHFYQIAANGPSNSIKKRSVKAYNRCARKVPGTTSISMR